MKVILKEEQQEKIKLPPFIYKAIVNKNTSIGDNEALPPFGDFGMEYAIARKGLEEADEVINNCIKNVRLESKDADYLLTVLNEKVDRCRTIEATLKPQLEKLCENIVNITFSIPSETINLKCELVGKVKPEHDVRILPEGDKDGNTYDFNDVDEVELTNKVISKRRFINALIQGLSYWLSTDLDDWYDTVTEMNDELWGLWYDIKHISDYLLYTKKDSINEKHPNLLSYVEVRLGKNGKKTEIHSQGIIFPYLLRDTFKGLFELFSAHGLPKDSKKALYIIKKADFLVAEPWDLRLGNGFIEMLKNSLTKKYQTELLFNTSKIPFFFSRLCQLKTDEFNSIMKNFLLGTKKGNIIANQMDAEITHNIDYQKFKDRIQQKNINTSIINDGDFSKEELDGYVIQENEVDEIMAYHGTGYDFDKFNHKKYLSSGFGSQCFGWGTYITNDKAIASGYAEESKGKYDLRKAAYLYEVDIPDDNGFNYLSWYGSLTNRQLNSIYSKMNAVDVKHNRRIFKDYKGFICMYDNGKCGSAVYEAIANCFSEYFEQTKSSSNKSKAASLFLMQCGFDGIKYPAGTIWQKPDGASENAYNYVIFDANKVKIVNKTKV